MPKGNISVFEFTPAVLQARVAHGLADVEHARRRAAALLDYLAKIDVKTIVEELEYVDKDYLEDYSGYYVSCFQQIPQKCRRLHFFSSSFTEDDFFAAISKNRLDGIVSDAVYKGFMVVRPLSQAPIGRTCLRTYPDKSTDTTDGAVATRYMTRLRYEANLCGVRLAVESVPYQEQDQVTAACATSAIWTALHVCGKRFQHQIPSPVTITKWATEDPSRQRRALPSSGLDLKEMLAAIRKVGLEPFVISDVSPGQVKDVVHAFARVKKSWQGSATRATRSAWSLTWSFWLIQERRNDAHVRIG